MQTAKVKLDFLHTVYMNGHLNIVNILQWNRNATIFQIFTFTFSPLLNRKSTLFYESDKNYIDVKFKVSGDTVSGSPVVWNFPLGNAVVDHMRAVINWLTLICKEVSGSGETDI